MRHEHNRDRHATSLSVDDNARDHYKHNAANDRATRPVRHNDDKHSAGAVELPNYDNARDNDKHDTANDRTTRTLRHNDHNGAGHARLWVDDGAGAADYLVDDPAAPDQLDDGAGSADHLHDRVGAHDDIDHRAWKCLDAGERRGDCLNRG